MAGNFNKVLLMGNLTRDIELRHTSGNQAVANIGLAVNRRYKAGDGEMREETTFVDCEAWGKTAETMAKYLQKGRPVFIEGRLKLDTWQDKNDGSNRSKLRVVVDNFQFIDSRDGGGGGGGGGGNYAGSRSGGGSSSGDRDYDSSPEPQDDDIPF